MKEQLTPQEEEELDSMMRLEQEPEFCEALKQYEQIPIPDELDDLVRSTIRNQTERKKKAMKKAEHKRSIKIAVRTLGALAAALVLFCIPLNTNESFAKQMQNVPVLGKLAQVLTIRSYSYTENDTNVNVTMPEIAAKDGADSDAAGVALQSVTTDFTDEINAQISNIVENYEADAKARFEEYKESFFATGGTEEEWAGRTCDINVDYEVTYQEGSVLSLVLTTEESWVAVYGERYYYNLDVESGKYITLQDLLGDDWVQICNESIDTQIKERLAEDTEEQLLYWGYGRDEDEYGWKFTTVTEDTSFYINAAGNPVVCFPKYEIAPGYMGIQEFEIVK